MTSFHVTYRGPSTTAVQAAATLADAPGVELTSAARPDSEEGADEAVVLALTLEGTPEAVAAALDGVRATLPPGATVTLDASGG
ncbi:MAG: hypothetical protein ACR2KK_14230 [Acidimicrobiales bacterium]